MRPTLLTHVLMAALYAAYTIISEGGAIFHLLALLFCFVLGAIGEGDRSIRFFSEVCLGLAVNALAWLFIALYFNAFPW